MGDSPMSPGRSALALRAKLDLRKLWRQRLGDHQITICGGKGPHVKWAHLERSPGILCAHACAPVPSVSALVAPRLPCVVGRSRMATVGPRSHRRKFSLCPSTCAGAPLWAERLQSPLARPYQNSSSQGPDVDETRRRRFHFAAAGSHVPVTLAERASSGSPRHVEQKTGARGLHELARCGRLGTRPELVRRLLRDSQHRDPARTAALPPRMTTRAANSAIPKGRITESLPGRTRSVLPECLRKGGTAGRGSKAVEPGLVRTEAICPRSGKQCRWPCEAACVSRLQASAPLLRHLP